MFGKNPIRKPAKGDGATLEVVKIFPTIQGEGPHAGKPAIFIRLGGCNLACNFCDTEFEDFNTLPLDDILQKVEECHINQSLIVITGGEPLRQPIAKLCAALIARNFTIQIETNGTLYQDLPPQVEIICSPKTKTALRPDLLKRITAFKFLISKHNADYSKVPNIGQTSQPIYIQPIDEYDAKKNQDNLELAKSIALEKGYNLSIQLHKIIGVE
ncbi:MAG: radical SAM protein [Alphaproteobacteria bacterium CG11_big_fil_rev_8_21_14_0_20_44_7]|nr:MAG: radical SAM protein [Alphaproteobacteria bacterium CG11_big_fil_rev_8_21_14_0_20_44_7]